MLEHFIVWLKIVYRRLNVLQSKPCILTLESRCIPEVGGGVLVSRTQPNY